MMINEELLYKLVGERVKALRQNLKITQEQLADEVGVTRTSITNIEKGLQRPPLQLLYKLSHTLVVDIVDLLPDIKDVIAQDGSSLEKVQKNEAIIQKIMSEIEGE